MNSTPHIAQSGIVSLVVNAGPVGQAVLLLLLFISMLCWAVILAKWRTLRKVTSENKRFLNFFWQSKSMDEIFSNVDQYARSPVAAVFRSGMKELRKLTGSSGGALDDLDLANVTRALQRSSNDEVSHLERHVTWLATVASSAPFVGLFGTVWGIMNSFQGIANSGSANLAVVAPGISEALIATAAGIGAAIPAAVFYNYFVNKIKKAALDMDSFHQDFLNIVHRSQLIAKGRGGSL